MKKIASLILLLAILVPSIGTYGWLQYHTRQVRREMKRRMIETFDKDELTLITLPKSESSKAIHECGQGEFEHEGEMFDIVYREESKDEYHFWCLPDHKESRINQQVKKLVENNAGNLPNQLVPFRLLTQFLSGLFFSEIDHLKDHDFSKYSLNPVSPADLYADALMDPFSPPPWQSCY